MKMCIYYAKISVLFHSSGEVRQFHVPYVSLHRIAHCPFWTLLSIGKPYRWEYSGFCGASPISERLIDNMLLYV